MSKHNVMLALCLAACRPQQSESVTPRATTSARTPAQLEPPPLPPGTALVVRPGATVWLDRSDARALQLPASLASGGLAVRVLGSVGDRIEVETNADTPCTLQPLRDLRLRIFVARTDLRDTPAPCVAPIDPVATVALAAPTAPPQATRILRSDTPVFWRDATPAGTVARDYTFAAPPSVSGAHTCFPFALAPGDELTLCFPSQTIAEVRPEPTTSLRSNPRSELGDTGLGGLTIGDLGSSGLGGDSGEARPRSAKPRSQVRLGTPDVSGRLDRDIVRRIVRSHIGELRFCYEAAIARHPKTHGKLRISFTIDGTGEVADAMPISSTIADAQLLACVAARVNGWKFPKPEGGMTVRVTCPFVLATE
ncbi:MAG: AgmX/PglI C-terminal domain-containing protein [Deltaproteobacteria bacterium]|nr:AgmX/PglI C-terminal domain-containing protein [Nannocystaceae bacterium]